MALSEKRQGEIALALIKLKFQKEGRIPQVSELKRELGNVSKQTGFSKEELTEFMVLLIEELTSNFVSEMKSSPKN